MKKSLIALAVLGSVTGAALAQSSVTIYGIVDLGLVKQNKADAATQASLGGVGMANKELNVAQGTKSRLGFMGVEDLGGGMSAKFELEHRLLPDTGATNTSGGNQFWDKSIVGVVNQSLGEIDLGRDYGPTFYSQYLLDPWLNQGVAEIGGTTYAFGGYNAGGHDARYNNAVFYKMKMGGLSLLATTGMSEQSGVERRYGLGVNFSDGPLFLTAAYDRAPSAFNALSSTGKKTDHLLIVGGAYDFGVIKPRLSVAQSNIYAPFTAETIKPLSVTLAATIPLGSGFIKAGYSQISWKGGNPVAQASVAGSVAFQTAAAAYAAAPGAGTGAALATAGAAGTAAAGESDMKQIKFALGYEYTLSKRTAIYTDFANGRTKGAITVNAFDLGVRHSF